MLGSLNNVSATQNAPEAVLACRKLGLRCDSFNASMLAEAGADACGILKLFNGEPLVVGVQSTASVS